MLTQNDSVRSLGTYCYMNDLKFYSIFPFMAQRKQKSSKIRQYNTILSPFFNNSFSPQNSIKKLHFSSKKKCSDYIYFASPWHLKSLIFIGFGLSCFLALQIIYNAEPVIMAQDAFLRLKTILEISL